MGIEANSDERYPYVWVKFRDDPATPYVSMFGDGRTFTPNVELTDEEAADLRDSRDRWEAWQDRLRAMLGDDD